MTHFKITVEYDGSSYCGWQRQKTDPTIQASLENALLQITGKTVVVSGSGRTDAGVHALGQVASFRADTRLDAPTLQRAMNSLLPPDIAIRSCKLVSDAFHARFSAKSKVYRYRIANRAVRTPIGRQYTWHVKAILDTGAMAHAVTWLIGTHDFGAFEGAGSPRRTRIRTVSRADLSKSQNQEVTFEIEADGFLRFMVRNIVGTLVAVGRKKITPAQFKQILDSKDRRNAGPTAPPHGLVLVAVRY
jgi:tRNA pseudouridine38-40 synthase